MGRRGEEETERRGEVTSGILGPPFPWRDGEEPPMDHPDDHDGDEEEVIRRAMHIRQNWADRDRATHREVSLVGMAEKLGELKRRQLEHIVRETNQWWE